MCLPENQYVYYLVSVLNYSFKKDLQCMFKKFTIFLKQSFPKSLIIYCYIPSQIVIYVNYASQYLSMNFWFLVCSSS